MIDLADKHLFSTNNIGLTLLAIVIAQYALAAVQHVRAQSNKNTSQLPPQYPVLIPYIGAIVPFLWNGGTFVRGVTSYGGRLTSARVAFWPGQDIFFFQDPQTIKQVWMQSQSFSSIKLRLFACKRFFGVPEKGLSIIAADDSGPLPAPDPRSNVAPEARVHYLVHDSNHRALTGPGQGPLQYRFKSIFMAHAEKLAASSDKWIDVPDLRKLVFHSIAAPMAEAIFGPAFVRLNPDFVDNLYAFNNQMPWLAKGMPELFMPKPYALRRKLHDSFKRWYKYAREHFDQSKIDADGDGDPCWGSSWMRQRQERLTPVQDDDTMAALDLGIAFGAIENTANCALMALFHIIDDQELLGRVREEVSASVSQKSPLEVNLKELSASNPLLSAVYAEALRLHVSSYIVIYSPRAPVSLGRWWLPQGSIGLVNSELAHMNDDVWNTKDGSHPLHKFWPDRFIVDPMDPSSGPRKPLKPDGNDSLKHTHLGEPAGQKPYFSMDGLESSWIPYGGGRLLCPGRFMAKNVILVTCAFLTRDFDIEILGGPMETATNGFGLGVRKPNRAITCRLRRRSLAQTPESA